MTRFARVPATAISCRELRATDWRVLTCIALHADTHGRAYPGMATIAEMTGIRRADVPRTLRRLERFGLITRERRRADTGSATLNLYTLTNGLSALARTGAVRTGADGGCPQRCGKGVRNAAEKVSATLRTKQTIEQTIEHTVASRPRRAREIGQVSANRFDDFWRTYPSRGGHSNPKKPAAEKFAAAVKAGADAEAIIAGARNYAAFVARSGTAGRFVAQATTWLAQRRWEQYADGDDGADLPLAVGMI